MQVTLPLVWNVNITVRVDTIFIIKVFIFHVHPLCAGYGDAPEWDTITNAHVFQNERAVTSFIVDGYVNILFVYDNDSIRRDISPLWILCQLGKQAAGTDLSILVILATFRDSRMCFTNLASLLSSTSIEHQYLRHLARHLFTQVKEYDAGIYVSASFYFSLEYMVRVAPTLRSVVELLMPVTYTHAALNYYTAYMHHNLSLRC